MQTEKKLNFSFTVNEANLILEALGELPAKRTLTLINNITMAAHQQVTAAKQIEQAKKPEAPERSIKSMSNQKKKEQ